MPHERWFDDYGNVLLLGQQFVDEGWTANALHYYFSKPWKWDREWELFVAQRTRNRKPRVPKLGTELPSLTEDSSSQVGN